MRTHRQGSLTRFTFTAEETHAWAHRPGAWWPCSALAGRRLSVIVDGADLTCNLIDVRVDGSRLPDGYEIPEHELSAFLADHATR